MRRALVAAVVACAALAAAQPAAADKIYYRATVQAVWGYVIDYGSLEGRMQGRYEYSAEAELRTIVVYDGVTLVSEGPAVVAARAGAVSLVRGAVWTRDSGWEYDPIGCDGGTLAGVDGEDREEKTGPTHANGGALEPAEFVRTAGGGAVVGIRRQLRLSFPLVVDWDVCANAGSSHGHEAMPFPPAVDIVGPTKAQLREGETIAIRCSASEFHAFDADAPTPHSFDGQAHVNVVLKEFPRSQLKKRRGQLKDMLGDPMGEEEFAGTRSSCFR